MGRISAGAERLGITCISAKAMDGRIFFSDWERCFDVVMTDVPCSGLGIIRKQPDIRYKDPALLEALPTVQSDILENTSRYVKPGGVLLYSTCTVLRRENQAVVEAFLEKHPEFQLECFNLPSIGTCSGMMTLWPHTHGTDGFFIAKLRRKHD